MEWIFKRSRITCFILLLIGSIFFAVPGWSLDPTVTDITTRSFSVIWTESTAGLGTCKLSVKKSGVAVDADQVVLESNADALARGIIKYEVIGLDYGTKYDYIATKKSGTVSGSVTTALFRGLVSADPEANDIVSNDIFHVTVFNSDAKTPALGALVMAEIYTNSACTTKKNASFLTGWVGSGMPGNPSSVNYVNKTFDPTDVSYKEYAPLNLNNLFADDPSTPSVVDLFPLQLIGDDPITTDVVEGGYIRVTVVPGITSVAGDTVRILPVPGITKVGNQGISSAKVATKIVFQSGMNTFSYPYEVPQGYTIKKLVETISASGGKVKQVKRYSGGSWPVASVINQATGIKISPAANGDVSINSGEGYLIIMDTSLPQNFYISGSPTPTSITIRSGMNVVNFTQIPSFYKIVDLVKAIYAAGGKVKQIKRYSGGSWPVASVINQAAGPKISPAANGEILIERGVAYLIIMDTIPQGTITVDPLLAN